MRKILWMLIALSGVYADAPAAIAAKLALSESEGYFIFSDDTYWRVSSFMKRWRTPYEWVVGDQVLVPENYLCDMQNWSLGDEFEAYPKMGNLRVSESDASNEEQLKAHSHLLINLRTEKILFATPIHPSDFVMEVYHHGYSEGNKEGYARGYSVGYSNGKAAAGAAYPR